LAANAAWHLGGSGRGEDVEECPEFGVATVIVYPPDADPEDLDVIPEAPFCMVSEGSSGLDTPELGCVDGIPGMHF